MNLICEAFSTSYSPSDEIIFEILPGLAVSLFVLAVGLAFDTLLSFPLLTEDKAISGCKKEDFDSKRLRLLVLASIPIYRFIITYYSSHSKICI